MNGLYASFIPLLASALLGSSRRLALGPTATVAVLTATVIEPLSGGSATQALALAATLALLVGGVCVLGGLLRGGFVVNFLSQPVLSGYVTGAALVIAASQLGKILGYSVSGDTFFQLVCPRHRRHRQHPGLDRARCGISLGSIVLLRRFAPCLAGVTHCRHPGHCGRQSVGPFGPRGSRDRDGPERASLLACPQGRDPRPRQPGLQLLGGCPGVLRRIDRRCQGNGRPRGYAVDATESSSRSVLRIWERGSFRRFPSMAASRGRPPRAMPVLKRRSAGSSPRLRWTTLLFLTPLFKNLPAATLGAVVIVAVSGLFDLAGLRRAWQIRREDFVMGVIALVGVLALGVLEGLLIAVGVSLVALVYHATLPHRAVLGYVPDDRSFRDIERFDTVTTPGVIVYRFDAPLFFANCRRLRDDVQSSSERHRTRSRQSCSTLGRSTSSIRRDRQSFSSFSPASPSWTSGLWSPGLMARFATSWTHRELPQR